MKIDQLPLDFDGASYGMLPTTTCSLPSSFGISSLPLRVPLDRRKEKRLLPFRRLARSVKPRIGRLAWTSKGGNDLGGGILGKLFGKGHGQTILEKEMSAMQKIILDKCPQCRHCVRMSNTNQHISLESLTKTFRTKRNNILCGYHKGRKQWIMWVPNVGFLPGYPPNQD